MIVLCGCVAVLLCGCVIVLCGFVFVWLCGCLIVLLWSLCKLCIFIRSPCLLSLSLQSRGVAFTVANVQALICPCVMLAGWLWYRWICNCQRQYRRNKHDSSQRANRRHNSAYAITIPGVLNRQHTLSAIIPTVDVTASDGSGNK